MEFVVILLMLALSAFFSGSEIAFVVANRLRVEVEARRSGFAGRTVKAFMQHPSTFLTTTLVGNNLALVIYSTMVAFYLQEPLDHFWATTVGLEAGSEIAALVTQTLIASLVVVILGEILPKSILREVANQAVFVLAIPLRITYLLLLPLIKLAEWSSSLIVKLFRADADSFSQFMRRDFEVIIQESRESGELELAEDESALLSNVFALSAIRVKESMVPRTDVVAVEESTSLEVLRERFIETGHSKLPVYRDNIDKIVGMAFAYDLFQEPTSLTEMMRPVQFVPAAKRSKELLRDFLASNTSVAVVIDEYGGTAGLVTREDLLEELFGDIQDEFDADSPLLRSVSEGTFVASGRANIDELAEKFGVHLPEGDYETVAGYLLEKLGFIPDRKEEFIADGYRFVILKASTNRIDLVRITRSE